LKKSIICASALPALLFSCAAPAWKEASSAVALEADYSMIRSGGHCESSAMLNALTACGYEFSEEQIIGYGAAPGFLYEKGNFPFIGGRNLGMRESFFGITGVSWGSHIPVPGESPWGGVHELLGRGVPVMLRVDMRYLPYRYGGKTGPSYMSFGWHWVTLFRIDGDRAWVSDTEYDGLQEIRLKDLDRARRSATKVWPPKAEFAWVEPRSADWRLDRQAATAGALEAFVDMADVPGGWLGSLKAFPSDVAALDEYVPAYLFSPALAYMAASIERNGTGGAAFRSLYLGWLESERDSATDSRLVAALDGLIPAVRACAAAWTSLAAAFDEASSKAATIRDGSGRRALAERCAKSAEAVVDAELLWALSRSRQ
jgi:hypothetical protein